VLNAVEITMHVAFKGGAEEFTLPLPRCQRAPQDRRSRIQEMIELDGH